MGGWVGPEELGWEVFSDLFSLDNVCCLLSRQPFETNSINCNQLIPGGQRPILVSWGSMEYLIRRRGRREGGRGRRRGSEGGGVGVREEEEERE